MQMTSILCRIPTNTGLTMWAKLIAFCAVVRLASFWWSTPGKPERPEIASWNKLRFLNFFLWSREDVPAF
jgi:hypothetical protein